MSDHGDWQRLARPGQPHCVLADERVFCLDAGWTSKPRAYLHDPVRDDVREIALPPWRGGCYVGTAEGWLAMLGDERDPSTRCMLYEPSVDRWHEMPAMPAPLKGRIVLVGGRIYVVSDQPMSWAPGEEWRIHPTLPELELGYLQVRALDDRSLVAWSRQGGPLLRFDGEAWSTLGTLERWVEIVATADGLLALGGLAVDETLAHCRAWTPDGWSERPPLARPRCDARGVRLADGRIVVYGGQRHDDYWDDSSTGGELDHGYRSFSRTREYGLTECEDLDLGGEAGWRTVKPYITFEGLVHPLRDGRVIVGRRSGKLDELLGTYLWTPPDR